MLTLKIDFPVDAVLNKAIPVTKVAKVKSEGKAPKEPLLKRKRLSTVGVSGAGSGATKSAAASMLVGRDQRSAVEDPTLTCVPSRQAAKQQSLNLLLRVRTNYRSVAGSRRQLIASERSKLALQAEQLLTAREQLRSLPRRKTALVTPPPIPSMTSTSSSAVSGLSATTTTVGKKKKSVSQVVANTGSGAGAGAGALPLVHRMQWMVVPEFLSEELWERHQYSFNDIRKTLDAFPARVLWQIVISYNRSATNASSRICSDSDLRMTFGAKSTAIQKILNVLKESHPEWASRPSVTWNMWKTDDPNGDGQFYDVSDRHVPGLPVHRINRPTFDHLLTNLVFWPSANIMSRSSSGANQASSTSIDKHLADSYYVLTGTAHKAPPSPSHANSSAPSSASTSSSSGSSSNDAAGRLQISVTTKISKSIFAWRGIHVVPLEINKSQDLLLVGRVVPWSVYVAAHGLPDSLRSCPNFILAPDGYYALLDESFYFYAHQDLFKSAAAAVLDAPGAAALLPSAVAKSSSTGSGVFKVPAPKKPTNSNPSKRQKPTPAAPVALAAAAAAAAVTAVTGKR